MTHQPMKPPTVVKFTNQPKTVAAPLEMVMKAKSENEDYPCTRSADDPPFPNKIKTHAESDGNPWKTGLCDSAEDLGGLTMDGKTEQDTRGSV